MELDERLGGGPVQVRVVQGKEPPHFLAIFGGNFTVFAGGVASAFDDVKRSVEVGSTYLLQIHGRYVGRPYQLYTISNRIQETEWRSAS